MTLKVLGHVLFVAAASAEVLGDRLIASMFKQEALPMNTTAAEQSGWTQLSGCNDAFGNRWRLGDRLTPTLMFGANGHIAGFQVVTNITTYPMYPMSNTRTNAFFEIPDSNDEERALSMYFSDPRDLCNPAATQEGLGDRFWLRNGLDSQEANDFEMVPLSEQDLVDATPTNGYVAQGCAPSGFAFPGSGGMGRHYWRYIAKDQVAVNAGPIFLLYNKGRLNAIGVSLVANNFLIPTEDSVRPVRMGGALVSQRPSLWEFAEQNLSPLIMDEDMNPTSMQNINQFNASLPFGDVTAATMHVFFSDPFSITCSPRLSKSNASNPSVPSSSPSPAPTPANPQCPECEDCKVEVILLICACVFFLILVFGAYRMGQKRTRTEMKNNGEMMTSFAAN